MKTILWTIILFGTSALLSAQSLNREITLQNNQKILIGKIDSQGLNQLPYGKWFQPNYNQYTFDVEEISNISEKLKGYHIKIFMGTWCGDSKREVPRFLKILDMLDFPSEKLKMIAVDVRKEFYKKSPTEEEWGLQILRVPTIIFYKNGREVNRIIETPNVSLEEDIRDIVIGNNYIPKKAKSMHFD